jgi:hypothetical protein
VFAYLVFNFIPKLFLLHAVCLSLCVNQRVNKNPTVGHTRNLDTDALSAEEDA